MKKEPFLNVSLDRVWVEEEVVADGTVKRSFFQERDERLERVYKHPVSPKWRLAVWCQEDHDDRRCDTFLGEVYATSEGDLWEARIKGLDQGDLAFQRMASPRAKKSKLPPRAPRLPPVARRRRRSPARSLPPAWLDHYGSKRGRKCSFGGQKVPT